MLRKESTEGKLNGVLLHVIHSKGVVIEEEAIKKIDGVIEKERRKLPKPAGIGSGKQTQFRI